MLCCCFYNGFFNKITLVVPAVQAINPDQAVVLRLARELSLPVDCPADKPLRVFGCDNASGNDLSAQRIPVADCFDGFQNFFVCRVDGPGFPRGLLDAAEKLKAEGIDAEVINVHTIKPIDAETVIESLKKTKCAVVAENHNVIGGLFSAVSEVAVQNCPATIVPVGVKDVFGEVGKLGELAEKFEMTEKDVIEAAKKAVAAK